MPEQETIEVRPPDLLTITQAAKRIGVDPNTLYRWASSEDAPDFIIKIGKRWKVSVPRLERYLHGSAAWSA